jgi:hypothetical protein
VTRTHHVVLDELSVLDARIKAASDQVEPCFVRAHIQHHTEHTALLISTLKWALLGAAAGACVGLGTRVFFWVLGRSDDWE